MVDVKPLERPKVNPTCDGMVFTWVDTMIEVELDRLAENKSDGITAELVFYDRRKLGSGGLLLFTKLNLLAPQTVRNVCQTLEKRRSDVDWHAVMEQVTFIAVQRYRQGEPVVDLREVEQRQGTRWLLEPFIEHDVATIIFADGGTGKSSVALALAVQAASGQGPQIGKLHGEPVPVLYLDWESDKAIHAERLRAICSAANIEPLPPIYYRRMVASLAESAATVRKDVEKLKAGLVIVDSMGAARGGEPESADTTIKLFNAARSFGCAWVGIDHVSKSAASNGDAKKPFGSAYTHHLARITWGMERTKEPDDDGSMVVALTNWKSNHGALRKALGYRMHYLTDDSGDTLLALYVQPVDLMAVPELASKMPLKERIMAELRGGAMTVAELAEALNANENQVAVRLSEMKRSGKVVKLIDRRYGLAAKA